MIVVVFQVEMKPGKEAAYFDLAARLRAELETIDGFLSVERFESLVTPGRYISLSFWRDEAAVADWRAQAEHSVAQEQGKNSIFADFRITVAETIRDYTLADRLRTEHHPMRPAETTRGQADNRPGNRGESS